MDQIIELINDTIKGNLSNYSKFAYDLIMAKYIVDNENLNVNPRVVVIRYLSHYFTLDIKDMLYEIAEYLYETDRHQNSFKWYLAAAESNHRKSQQIVSDFYQTGYIVEKNPVRAELYRRSSVEFRFSDIINDIFKLDKETIEFDRKKLQLLLQMNIDSLIDSWIDNYVSFDKTFKLKIYKELAKRDYFPAFRKCAEICDLLKNEEEALMFHTLASEREDIKSQLYFADKHYAMQDPHCIKWYEVVLQNNNSKNEYCDLSRAKERAYKILGDCYYNGTFVDKNHEKAFEMYKLANSEHDLAKCYASGKGVSKNVETATEILRKTFHEYAEKIAKYYEHEEAIKAIESGNHIIVEPW